MSRGMLGMLNVSEVQRVMSDLYMRLAGPVGPVILDEMKALCRLQVGTVDMRRQPTLIGPDCSVMRHEFDSGTLNLLRNGCVRDDFDLFQPAPARSAYIAWCNELENLAYHLNANLLDHYLRFPALIPRRWDGRIFFFGTLFQGNNDDLPIVRGMEKIKDRWLPVEMGLEEQFRVMDRVAFLRWPVARR